MHELRKDYLLNRWAIISTERAKRPRDFVREHPAVREEGPCPFCPGNERLTPPEIARIEENGEWLFRVFPNKFPAVTLGVSPEATTRDIYFTSGNAFGKHEVIVETPNHSEQLADLSTERIAQLLQLLFNRSDALRKIEGVKYVAVFKNHGLEAGTSLVHEHSQIVAYNRLPTKVIGEIQAINRHYRKHHRCPYCGVIEFERKGPRRIAENNSFAAFAPFASRFGFEAFLASKEHVNAFSKLDDAQLQDMAGLLKKILLKLKELNTPYNLYFHDGPKGKRYHAHVKIIPRLLTWGGFEHCTGCIINTVSPEQAAEFYREQ